SARPAAPRCPAGSRGPACRTGWPARAAGRAGSTAGPGWSGPARRSGQAAARGERYGGALRFVKTFGQPIDNPLTLLDSRATAPTPMGHAMRIGLAGVGRIGAFHADTLRQLAGVESLVLADADPGRAHQVADKLGVTALAEPGGLFRAGLDALVIAASTGAHAPLILAAADAGLPVFCEKPVAGDLGGTLGGGRRG